MTNKNKYFFLFFSILLLFGCSFDKQTGVWQGKEEEIAALKRKQARDQNKEIIEIYSQLDTLYSEEIESKNN